MTDDAKLSALFRDATPIDDAGFTRRVLALAALEDRIAVRRRATIRQLCLEGVGTATVIATYVAFVRIAPVGDVVPLFGPAMTGLLLLASWLAVGIRSSCRAA